MIEKDKRIMSSQNVADSGEQDSSKQNTYEEETVYQKDGQGNELPYVYEIMDPEVTGVLVTAQGADDMLVSAEIIEAVKALFGIDVHKIKVMKMK